jgi:hypothetical protein
MPTASTSVQHGTESVIQNIIQGRQRKIMQIREEVKLSHLVCGSIILYEQNPTDFLKREVLELITKFSEATE